MMASPMIMRIRTLLLVIVRHMTLLSVTAALPRNPLNLNRRVLDFNDCWEHLTQACMHNHHQSYTTLRQKVLCYSKRTTYIPIQSLSMLPNALSVSESYTILFRRKEINTKERIMRNLWERAGVLLLQAREGGVAPVAHERRDRLLVRGTRNGGRGGRAQGNVFWGGQFCNKHKKD